MSMYFSLITPASGRERDAAHEWAGGSYEEHQWLWRFLPAPQGTARDFLFRRRDIDGMPRFYVVSKREPVSPTTAWRVQSQAYAPRLHPGDRLNFELRANPVITQVAATGQRARHDVVMQAKRTLLRERGLARWSDWTSGDRPDLTDLVYRTCGAWLQSRAERLGVTFDGDRLMAEGYTQHRGRRNELRFSTVDFSGTLTVVEPTALLTALHGGVGHAKAFGCGLLLVRPLG